MNLFKKMGQSLGFIPENPTEEIMEQRSKMKQQMADQLKSIGFSDDEIDEVLNILNNAEKRYKNKKIF